MEKTVQKRTVFQEEMAKVFINGKDTMSVGDVDQLKRHVGSPLHGVFITTGRTETAVASERNELQFAASGTAIHGTAKSRITTMNHLLNVFDDSVARMKRINHFFKMIRKDFLEDIHTISMRETVEKENPQPPS